MKKLMRSAPSTLSAAELRAGGGSPTLPLPPPSRRDPQPEPWALAPVDRLDPSPQPWVPIAVNPVVIGY